MLLQILIAAAAAATASPPVPAGVQIPVTMVSSVNSASAKVGDAFDFRTTQDVRAGSTLIPSGTLGHGIVSAVSHAAGNHRGTLTLAPQYLILASGERVTVASTTESYAARRHVFPFLVPGVIVGVENPGGNVTIGPGTNFKVVTGPASSTHPPG